MTYLIKILAIFAIIFLFVSIGNVIILTYEYEMHNIQFIFITIGCAITLIASKIFKLK